MDCVVILIAPYDRHEGIQTRSGLIHSGRFHTLLLGVGVMYRPSKQSHQYGIANQLPEYQRQECDAQIGAGEQHNQPRDNNRHKLSLHRHFFHISEMGKRRRKQPFLWDTLQPCNSKLGSITGRQDHVGILSGVIGRAMMFEM